MSKYKVSISGATYDVEILKDSGNRAQVSVNGVVYEVEVEQEGAAKPLSVQTSASSNTSPAPSQPPLARSNPGPAPAPAPTTAKPGVIQAPMPGVVLEVKVSVGQRVQAGDVVVRIEAMKMENDITTTVDGVVAEVKVRKGDNVQERDVLVVLAE